MGGEPAQKEGERKGDFLGGKYLLEDCLGIGGMGEVYRATNVSLDRKVAIKLLNKEHTSNEDDVLRFLREARAAAAVRHPNVVDVFDVARDDDGTPFIVQELLSGEDLEQYLGSGRGRLPAEEALEIMIPVAEAVSAAHTRSVVHRDLKPANIFLAREGNRIIPKVLDFGACLYQTVGALSTKERRMLIGTPHYMAPEQITTAMEVDARADVWAIGVILYELLAGETPFEAEDANTVLKLVKTQAILPLRKVAPNASIRLEACVMRCLERDRNKRFSDAQAVRDELEAVKKDLHAPAAIEAIKIVDKTSDKAAPKKKVDDAVASSRVPSLILSGKPPTKRRGASLLMLSAPEEPVAWDSEPPKSSSRPIEPARPSARDPREEPRDGPKPARTAADVIREADAVQAVRNAADMIRESNKITKPARTAADVIREAEAGKITKPARTAADVIREAEAASKPSIPPEPVFPSLRPPADSGPSLPAMPPQVMGSTPPTPMREHKHEPGAPRDLDIDPDDASLGLDLDLEPPSSRAGAQTSTYKASHSSMPPVLDPRIATNTMSYASDRPPKAERTSSDRPRVSTVSKSDQREASRESSLTPPLTPLRAPRAATAPAAPEPPPAWSSKENGRFAGVIVGPALVAFFVLRLAPSVTAPLAHAMRGDSAFASGALAIIALVGAAALAALGLGRLRSTGMLIATVGAVLLGVVMIIVTFSASDAVDLDTPPPASAIVPFVAPLVPLGLGLAAFGAARRSWLSRYDRAEAVKLVVVTSFMLLAMLVLGPFGAVRSTPYVVKARPTAPAAP